MTLRPRAVTLLAAALGLALGACGGSLYDAAGVPKVDAVGCTTAGTHLCNGQCVADENPQACGPTCIDCTGEPVPPRGTLACVQTVGAWGCGFKCTLPDRVCATRSACLPDDVNACGTDCQVCPGPSTGAGTGLATCGPPSGGGVNACGFTCAAGFLQVGGGCERPTAVAAGAAHACAITTGGGLVCWGSNDLRQLGPNGVGAGGPAVVEVFATGVTSVAAGGHHTCAIHLGLVKCWGSNAAGQLGSGAAGVGGATPVTVSQAGATALAAGAGHTCAVVAGGAVRCWGANALGQLGTGDQTSHPAPFASLVTSGAGTLAAFADTTCAVVGAGLRCWGANGSGQAGKVPVSAFESTPVTVPLPSASLLVSVGEGHACAILAPVAPGTDTPLWCWGSDAELQLGTQSVPTTPFVPVLADKIARNNQAAVIATGGGHTCTGRAAAIETGLTCSGRSNQGQTGVVAVLAQPEGAVPLPHVAVATAGTDHSCALVDLGAATGTGPGPYEVHCWGRNAEGQLGRVTPAGAADPAPKVVGQ